MCATVDYGGAETPLHDLTQGGSGIRRPVSLQCSHTKRRIENRNRADGSHATALRPLRRSVARLGLARMAAKLNCLRRGAVRWPHSHGRTQCARVPLVQRILVAIETMAAQCN